MKTKPPPCVIGKYCKDHDFVHGAEAEDLRHTFEELIRSAKLEGENFRT